MWFNSLHCPLNPPILGDFESCSPQIWGARGAWLGTLSLYETALPSIGGLEGLTRGWGLGLFIRESKTSGWVPSLRFLLL
jgi:hypothetical protein